MAERNRNQISNLIERLKDNKPLYEALTAINQDLRSLQEYDESDNKDLLNKTNILRYFSHVKTNASQTITTATPTKITFNTVVWDANRMFNNANDRIIIPKDGRYQISAILAWAANATGFREINIYVNGASTEWVDRRMAVTTAAFGTFQPITLEDFFYEGDYIEVFGYQNSGGNLGVGNLASGTNRLVVHGLSNWEFE